MASIADGVAILFRKTGIARCHFRQRFGVRPDLFKHDMTDRAFEVRHRIEGGRRGHGQTVIASSLAMSFENQRRGSPTPFHAASDSSASASVP